MKLLHGDCLELMRDIPNSSVDLILTDPPYFKVKKNDWDNQWDDSEGFIDFIGEACAQWARILKPSGSIYVFASPELRHRVQVEIETHFQVLNSITWVKPSGWHKGANKGALRSFFPQTEAIIFAEQYGADSMALGESGYKRQIEKLRGFVFEPLRKYFADEKERCGISTKEIMAGMARLGMPKYMFARHTFTSSQWQMPTREMYEAARLVFNSRGGEHLRREYEYLRREYEYLRREYEHLRREYEHLRREYEHLRRPFSVSKDINYTDVWSFDPVKPRKGKHPCEKPIELLEHIITVSSKPGGIVLDSFMGSGSTGAACLNTGRQFIGIEKDPNYFKSAAERLGCKAGIAA
ncbi:site-specific DNA-methyltransferase [Endozoicomonas sp. Mp262]|uniref:DNA methyltransferase n=1 Tax=Endozoicomonas sp. Mp262 TaxID=2919499 RepID=UPI0021D86C1C